MAKIFGDSSRKTLWIFASVIGLVVILSSLRPPHILTTQNGTSGGSWAPANTEAPTTTPDAATVPVARSYLLTVNIEQQATAGLFGYGDLASLAGYLNLSSVEPYIAGNKLVGVGGWGKAHAITLSTLYDFKSLQSAIQSCYNTTEFEMSSFQTFLKQASREVIYVHILHSIGKYKSKFSDRKSKIVEIGGNKEPEDLARLNKWAASVAKESNLPFDAFKINHVFVVDARPKVALPIPTIKGVLGSAIHDQISKRGSVTVLFDNWRAIHIRPDSGYFYYVPYFCRPCFGTLYNISHSQKVVEASQAFGERLNDSKTNLLVGVHIRAERLLLKYKGNFVKCLKELSDTVKSVSGNISSIQARIHVIHDFSKYGSKTCWGDCSRYRSKYHSELKKLKFSVVYYEPEEYPSFPKGAVFASFVERKYLSKADVLVTVGHGGFQDTVIKRFLEHSEANKGHLHRICSETW